MKRPSTLPICFIVFFAILLASPQLALARLRTGCLSYEPAVVRLKGTLVRQAYPGPPNYESIRKGDRPEIAWFVKLTQPVCMNPDPTDETDFNLAYSNVRRIHLVILNETIYKPNQKFVAGERVMVIGTLFGKFTPHHHSPVLMTVHIMQTVRPRRRQEDQPSQKSPVSTHSPAVRASGIKI